MVRGGVARDGTRNYLRFPMGAQRPLDLSRAQVMRLTSRMLAFLWLPLLVMQAVAAYAQHDPYATASVIISALVAAAALVMWRPWAERTAVQGTLFLVLVYTGLCISLLLRGLQVRSTVAMAVLVVWATLYYGARGLVATTVALSPLMAYSAYRVGWRGDELLALDATGPGGATRSVTWVLVGLVLCGLVVRAALQAFESAMANERRALERQHAADLARAAAEQNAEVLERRHLAAALAVGLAHDLNNAVQVTAMNASMLVESENPETRDVGQEILRAAERAEKMVRSLQAFGRTVGAEAGGFPVQEAVDGLRILLRGFVPKSVATTFHCESVAVLRGDELQFSQVIINLVINAVDAMPNGGTLELRVEDDPRGFCVVRVRDTGSGIADAVRAQMFEPYFSTKPPREGGGLGLTMVSRLVTQVGGRVDVASTVGEGTTFTIAWPVENAAAS